MAFCWVFSFLDLNYQQLIIEQTLIEMNYILHCIQVLLLRPSSFLILFQIPFLLFRILSESLNVGLNYYVNKWFEKAEQKPNIYHLDVGSWRQICAYARNRNRIRNSKICELGHLRNIVVKTNITVTFKDIRPSKKNSLKQFDM